MRRLAQKIAILLLTAALTACSASLAQPTVLPPTTLAPVQQASPVAPATTGAPALTPTKTLSPAPTATVAIATATSAPTAIATATTASDAPTVSPTGSAGGNLPDYLDDRSTPSGLILSLFNALNRKEYLRAYSYWENPAANSNVGTLDQFQKGYADTASVEVTLGNITSGHGAGQIYYSVPIILRAQTTDSQTHTFVGCYTTHLGQPANQTVPPYHPQSIQSASIKQIDNTADPNSLLSTACQPAGGPPNPIPTTDPNTVAASNYLDDRSTAVEVLRSLFNGVNRKEYARAYSYWQNPGTANNVPPYAQFQQGYRTTASVDATFGVPTADVGAGQIRYRVPTGLKVQTTDGKTQLFVGCYLLHLGQPTMQATPPFQPLGIERASVQQVASDADLANQMTTACANMP